jgi:hypothetical protein
MTAARRARGLLAAGAAGGLAVAAAALVGAPSWRPALPAGAVAVVNGVPIRGDDYARALTALAADRREPLGDDDRRRVLDRLIDEELLVQRGLALGLPQRDRIVRGDLVRATIDAVATPTDAPVATRDEVEAFYRANRDWFAEPGRVRVEQVFVRVGSADDEASGRARADAAAARLRAGDDLAAVRRDLGDDEVAPLPAAPLPASTLREYVGETVTQATLALPVGSVGDPVRSGAGFHVLRVVEREAPRVPTLDEVADAVSAELRREHDEQALRAALDGLRRDARVRVADPGGSG